VLFTVLIGLGLLAMHALTLVEQRDAVAHSPTPVPHTIHHTEVVHFDGAPDLEHGHPVHHCVWIVAAAIVVLAALVGFWKRPRGHGAIRSVLARVVAAVERAPPNAARLSLVGISRR
jgi:hypothetical protein